MYTPVLEINLSALRHNLTRVHEFAPDTRVMAMIKANAYGHGAVLCARALDGADAFGAARLDEALLLREGGIVKPILVMCGVMEPSELPVYQEHHLDVLVHHPDHITMLEAYDGTDVFNVWFKIDTGLNRLGFRVEDAQAAHAKLSACRSVKKPFNIMSHCVVPERMDKTFTQEQIDAFLSVADDLPGEKSFAKSAAIMAWPQTHFDWVRPGIMLYGISPFPDKTAAHLDLKPVMSLRSTLVRVDHRRKGENLGYGGEVRCPEDMPVGIVALGYADGYPRHLIAPAPVLVNGKRCQTIARIAMDLMMIDLRNAPEAKKGDDVVMWGDGLPIEEVAKAANTIPYTLTTAMTARVRRVIIDN
jgi:alanine racemase